ncbi:MAG: hypothetical protein WDN49_05665 [Acetobacteraceae bacterium]
MSTFRDRMGIISWQIAILAAVLAIWQWGFDLYQLFPRLVPDILDPYFVSKPTEIGRPVLGVGLLQVAHGGVDQSDQWRISAIASRVTTTTFGSPPGLR